MSQLWNNRNLALYSAVGLGTMHLMSACSMSCMRVYYGGIKKDNEFFKSSKFKVFSRTQLNIAEYIILCFVSAKFL